MNSRIRLNMLLLLPSLVSYLGGPLHSPAVCSSFFISARAGFRDAHRPASSSSALLTNFILSRRLEDYPWDESDSPETVGVLLKVNHVRQLLLGELSFAVSAAITQQPQNLIFRYLHDCLAPIGRDVYGMNPSWKFPTTRQVWPALARNQTVSPRWVAHGSVHVHLIVSSSAAGLPRLAPSIQARLH